MRERLRMTSALRLGLVVLAAASAVPVQANEMTFAVPFKFVVNGRTLPAGRYRLTSEQSTLFVLGYQDSAAVVTVRAESRNDPAPRLVFRRYRDRYVLAVAWMGDGSGRVIPASRLERELTATTERDGRSKAAERIVSPTP